MARTPKVVADRREQIIEAAMRVFARKGFARTTNKDIAREAAITPGLIYHYFESKEAVFQAILEERSPLRLMQTLPASVLERSPGEFFHFLIQQVLELVESEQFVQLISILLPEVIHNPDISPAEVLQRALGFLERYVKLKMEQGELRVGDASLVAQVLVGSVMGFVLRRQILRDPLALQYSHEQIADAIVATMLHGLLTE